MSVAMPGIRIDSDRDRGTIRFVLAAFAFSIALSMLAFHDAWLGMMRVWMASETFTHGFIAVPFAVWMVWRNRDDWSTLPARVWWPGLVLLAGFAAMWIVGRLAGVASVEQLAAVAMIPATMATLVGLPIVAALAFPLAFLFFAVPIGEFLTPILMDYTADATVLALQWTGVPVYREGLFLTIPTGRWAVVEACSGLRYLIASLALGVVFAYLQFRTLKYRLAFMALSLIVPIVANWIRAYMIVMIGHLSSMKLAAGADHLIYGWVFFGIVMGLLFWFGSRWREPAPAAGKASAMQATQHPGVPPPHRGPGLRRLVAAGIAALLFALLARPLAGAMLDATEALAIADATRKALGANDTNAAPTAALPWAPAFADAADSVRTAVTVDGRQVEAHVFYYARQHDGQEMIHANHQVQPLSDNEWPIRSRATRDTGWGKVDEYRIGHPGGQLMVWHWYQVAGTATPNAYVTKGLTALALLTGQGDHSVAAVLATPVEADTPEGLARARRALESVASRLAPVTDAISRGEPGAK